MSHGFAFPDETQPIYFPRNITKCVPIFDFCYIVDKWIFTLKHYEFRTIFRSLLFLDFFEQFLNGKNPLIKASASLLQLISALSVIV